MDKKRQAAFKYAEKVLREIAAKNEYPPLRWSRLFGQFFRFDE